MLQKTKENQSDILEGPTMLMKINGLIFGSSAESMGTLRFR